MSVLNLLKTIFHPTLYRKPSAKVACHDLSPVTVTEFTVDGVKRTLKEPLILIPQLTEDRKFMFLENNDWGIDVAAETREDLMRELSEEFEFLWKHCVEKPDEKLGIAFLKWKKTILSAI